MSNRVDYPGRTSCGCPYINRPDPEQHRKDCHCRLNAGHAAAAQDEREAAWGYAGTIGNLVAQLRTLDPDMEIYSPHRLADGRVALDGLTLSREWKLGRWLQKDAEAKRVAVIWTQPDARSAQTEQQPVAWKARCTSMAPGLAEVTLRVDAGLVPGFMDPGRDVYVSEAAPIAHNAPQPEQSRLVEALQLAANRLDRLGLNQPPHTKEYHEARDWAEEAFSVLRDCRAPAAKQEAPNA